VGGMVVAVDEETKCSEFAGPTSCVSFGLVIPSGPREGGRTFAQGALFGRMIQRGTQMRGAPARLSAECKLRNRENDVHQHH
jgi:hypothetical protein